MGELEISPGPYELKYDKFFGQMQIYANGEEFDANDDDVKLFLDALETYQQSEHTPSELLSLYQGATESSLGKDKEIADLKKQNDRLREALEGFVRLKDLYIYSGEILPSHEGEAIALSNALSKAEEALKTSKQ